MKCMYYQQKSMHISLYIYMNDYVKLKDWLIWKLSPERDWGANTLRHEKKDIRQKMWNSFLTSLNKYDNFDWFYLKYGHIKKIFATKNLEYF